MIFNIEAGTPAWQVVAALRVAQAAARHDWCAFASRTSLDIRALAQAANVHLESVPLSEAIPWSLAFEGAMVLAEARKQNYDEVLAQLLGEASGRLIPPLQRLELGISGNGGGIVICPFPLKDFGLTANYWVPLVRHLRTYGKTVKYVGDAGQRLDHIAFAEDEAFSDRSVADRIDLLSQADLIVGVPNAWTWLATAWNKPILLFYPDTIERRVWFPYDGANMGWLLYAMNDIATPVLLAGTRKVIANL